MYGTDTCLSHSKRPQLGDDFFVYDLSVFVLDTPGNAGACLFGKSIRRPAAYRVHGPFYPSVVLTEPSLDGSLIML